MNIFIFENANKVSNNYHEDGGLVVVARDIERVKQLLVDRNDIGLTEEDYNAVVSYPLKGKHDEKIFVFPDAGCC